MYIYAAKGKGNMPARIKNIYCTASIKTLYCTVYVNIKQP